MKRLGVLAAVMAAVIGISGCGVSAEDAKEYVKASLDANYKQEYAAYADFVDESEEDAAAEMEEAFQKQIDEELSGVVGISDEAREAYAEADRSVLALAKYEVKDAKKSDDGFQVAVEVEPSNIYDTIEASATEAASELMESDSSVDLTEANALAELVTESVKRSVEKNEYGEPQTVQVSITKKDGTYTFAEGELEKLHEALFPGSTK